MSEASSDGVSIDFSAAEEILIKESRHLAALLVTGFLPENQNIEMRVKANTDVTNKLVLIEIEVDGRYVGRLIGREGKAANAIREILKRVGKMYKVTVSYNVSAIGSGQNDRGTIVKSSGGTGEVTK